MNSNFDEELLNHTIVRACLKKNTFTQKQVFKEWILCLRACKLHKSFLWLRLPPERATVVEYSPVTEAATSVAEAGYYSVDRGSSVIHALRRLFLRLLIGITVPRSLAWGTSLLGMDSYSVGE